MKLFLSTILLIVPFLTYSQYSIKECGQKPREVKKTKYNQSQEEFEKSSKYLNYLSKYTNWKSCVDSINNTRLYSYEMKTDENGLVFLDSVFLFEGYTKDELYNFSKEWIATVFNSAPDVMKLDDQKNGKIIVKGLSVLNSVYPSFVLEFKFFFSMKFLFKDNRFKVIISDFKFQNYPDKYNLNPSKISYDSNLINPYENDGITPSEAIARVKEKMLKDCFNSFESLSTFIKKSKTYNDDW